ncbi:TetR family transcriptional regulator [Deinococcus roseus]|uniref:TetR family transcriptional regulator n=1 Tax=Deinococcus roseus TaxID=392414 RepID=A0ABQ2D283_9DEIO|nr:TetR family transcriptional regulator [Deinococcus roseus]GGJ40799.1 TetR family transcriptional regulator [Deinococcus roseus]
MADAEGPLTTETILDTAEQVLRRFGLSKATVVDVARALDVSHGTVYRYFPSKTALRAAVTQRWLHRVSAPLAEVKNTSGTAPEKLHLWLTTLMQIKRSKVLDDPELFHAYQSLFGESKAVLSEHVSELLDQLTVILEEGIQKGEIRQGDPTGLAEGIFYATSRFHHPINSQEWLSPTIDREFEQVWDLIVTGLKT